jgi:lipopolysaccharide/colanic/teichoic acid biosynthesis glycosyltransferase
MNIIYTLFILVLIIISLPAQILIALVILAASGFPIIFQQKRIGLNGQVFVMFKFRTMIQNSEKLKSKYYKQNEVDGPVFKIRNDPRFTPIGKWLSHTGLDELPQLINVIKGEMALFGPRPLPIEEASKLTTRQKKREQVKPGIISPWVFNGYHNRSFSEWMDSDINYTKRKSLKLDLILFWKAIIMVCKLFINEIEQLYF